MSYDDEIDDWFANLSFKAKRGLATVIKEQADGLADAIKAAAPVKTGALRDSVKVRRRRNDLELEVTVGGDATTRNYDRSTGYERNVVIDGRNNQGIAKQADGAGVTYDYSLAVEFGTENMPAHPFVYNTYRARKDDIDQAIADAVEKAVSS